METLLALQELQMRTRLAPELEEKVESLRKKVPESIVGGFDRWLTRRKKAVAIVRGGVCSECHIKIAVGTLANLATGDTIEHCGNCGRLLYLPQDEPVYEQPAITVKPARTAKTRKAVHVS